MSARTALRPFFTAFTLFALPMAGFTAPPAEFVQTDISRPTGGTWDEAVGLTFDANGTMYVWERKGRIWVVDEEAATPNPAASPLLDISAEVGGWRDFGLLGVALDPNFLANGYVYLLYVVDRHHLLNCNEPASGTGMPICGGGYNPTANAYFNATIGRITRYTVDFTNGMTVDYGSRKVLLGEAIDKGIPILHQSHGTGSLVFGTDGTLLASTGDGASYSSTDTGSAGETYWQQALEDGIIRPEENVGAYRAQMLSSLNGKILRLDPATGNGVASNPFYDPAKPRSARSRVWALGLRNPFRFTLRPDTGSHDPADGMPGSLYIGDVGWNTWEELNVSAFGGENFGWPAFEGMTGHSGYQSMSTPNADAPNPMFGINGCTQEFFYFRELIKQESLNPVQFTNACDGSPIPSSVDTFVLTRPIIDWRHGVNNARWPSFALDGSAVAPQIGEPDVIGQTVEGTVFLGNSSTGGVWYTGDDFPPEYRNTYFHGDYGSRWIRNFVINSADFPVEVRQFDNSPGGVIAFATNPVEGHLYFISWGAMVKRVTYEPSGNRDPVAVASFNPAFGASPLTIQFSSAASSDADGVISGWEWDFGDGTISTAQNPQHTFIGSSGSPQSFDVTLTVTDNEGAAGSTRVLVSVNNTPPSVSITSPADGTLYPITGDTVYELTATIFDDEHSGTALECAWQTTLHHNNHIHDEPVDNACSTTTTISPLGCSGQTYFFTVTLTVADAAGLSAADTVTLYPNCGADASPVANNDAATVELGGEVDIAVTTNDFDDTGLDLSSLAIVGQPTAGSVSIQPDTGLVTYQSTSPVATDRFLYTIRDIQGQLSNTAEVTVTIEEQVRAPSVSPGAGTYASYVQVTLTTATGGATIYYTLDGTDPDENSAVYSGVPILIASSTTLKARAFKAGLEPSPVTSAAYAFQSGSDNIAPLAAVTASSIYSPAYSAENAVDGIADGDPNVSGAEWATRREKVGAWLNLDWTGPGYAVSRIVLHDRPNDDDQVTSANIVFSNGSSISVGTLPNDSTPIVIDFPERSINSLRFTVTGTSSSTKNIGLAEIEVIGVAQSSGPTANADSVSVTEGQSIVISVLDNDFAGRGLEPGSVATVALPSSGVITAIDTVTGAITYLHDGGPSVADSFTYTFRDQAGVISNEGTVDITVNPDLPPAINIVSPTDGEVISGPPVIVRYSTSGDSSAYDHVFAQLDSQAPIIIHDMSTNAIDLGVVAPGAHEVHLWLADSSHMALPNPEASDEVDFTVAVAKPEMSPPGGIYDSPVLVSLSTATSEATIFYTLDGSNPDTGSVAYSGSPILIDINTTLMARAFVGASSSSIATADYVFQSTLTNIAPQAVVTASSQYSSAYSATNAVDRLVDGDPDPIVAGAEWASRRESVGAWLNLDWGDTAYEVTHVVLYDRLHPDDQVLSGMLAFSDGSTVDVGVLANDGAATPIDFAPRVTTNIRLTVTGTSATTSNIGLAEIEVFGDPATSQAPVTDAGPDQTLVDLDGDGIETVLLDGSGSFDADGIIVNYRWTDGTTLLAEGTSAMANADLGIGGHDIALETTDDEGLTSIDRLIVSIDPQPANSAPVVNAGTDKIAAVDAALQLADATIEDDGLPIPPGNVSVTWTQVSGPAAAVWLDSQSTINPLVEFSAAGTYVLRLTGDDGELTALDEVTVNVSGEAAIPVFSPTGGTYSSPVYVSLSSATEGAVIHYTLDGTDPNQQSAAYAGPPILIDTDTMLKARSYKDGLDPSPIASTSYVFAAGGENIALVATATASSQYSSNYAPGNAIDGIVDGDPDPTIPGAEWATYHQEAGAWLDIDWGGTAYEVHRVVLYDRPHVNDQVRSGTLSFSDGSSIEVGALPNDGAPVVIDFTPRIVTSMRFTVTGVSANTRNVGLAEIELFGQVQ